VTAQAEQALLRDNAARFAEQSAGLGLLGRKPFDDAQREAWMEALAAGAWTGLRAHEDIGGMGLSCLELTVVLEQFGRKLLPKKTFETQLKTWV
jgi:alkylation response protein AidB-like acyl-CoA dehydrogenase